MEKIFYLILILFILGSNIIYSDELVGICDSDKIIADDKSECINYLQDEEKDKGYDCCYIQYKMTEGTIVKTCHLMEKKDAKNYKKLLEEQGKTDISVLCNKSHYLQFSLLSLIVILL